jgi:ribonuclease J
VPNPEAKNGMKVYFNQHFEQTWKRRNLSKIRRLFLKERIELETILSQPDDYVMVSRPSLFKDDFRGIFPPETVWIYSYWEGYLNRPGSDYSALESYLTKSGGDFVTCHTSGHIFADDIENFVKAVNPRHIVPIHTTGRNEFLKRFKNLLSVEDGQVSEF